MSGPSKRIEDLSPEEKRALLARARRNKPQAARSFPLSFAQQRLWFLDQLVPGNSSYNVPLALRLTGALNIAALQGSLEEIVRRHTALRTTFELVDGQPAQLIQPAGALPLPLSDLSALPDPAREAEARRMIKEEAGQPFDLTRGPLLRVKLLALTPREHILVLNVHHIVFDGWSVDVLLGELTALYNAFAAGAPAPLSALAIQYVDFAVWQQQGQALEAQLAYWQRQLHNLAPLDIPTDFPRPPVQAFQGASQEIALPPALHAGLTALSQQSGTTMFMTLLAAFQLLLARYSGQADIAVATAVANRSRPETQGMIGFFVNTLVLRTDLSGNRSFRQVLEQVRAMCLDAYANQDLPFEQLVMALRPDRQLSHQPLVQTTFVLQSDSGSEPALDGLSVEYVDLASETVKYDLSLAVLESPAGLRATIEYRTDLFQPATIGRMLGQWRVLLEGIVANPDRHISELPLLTDAERQLMLVDWNATAAGYPDATCAHRLFEAQVEQTPDAVAVYWRDTRLTYRELDQRACQLAHYLRGLSIGLEDVVALGLDRSIDFVVGVLGVWKAGAAYVPLDPAYPRERLDYMVRAGGARVLLTQTHLLDRLPSTSIPIICLDREWERIGRLPASSLADRASADNLAYIIFTSGSTGQPKGVMATHRGLCNVVAAQRAMFEPTPHDTVLQFASVSFDASIFEIVMALATGASLRVAEDESRLAGPALAELLRGWGVTIMTISPAVLAALPASALPAVRTINVAGDVCPPDLVTAWAPGRRFFNLYGPTETSIWATAALCVSDAPVTIGRPIANTQVYLLDAHMQPVPLGVPGELYIGGVGVTRGYIGRPDLSAERFVPNPFTENKEQRTKNKEQRTEDGGLKIEDSSLAAQEKLSSILYPLSSSRLYRTADVARYRPDGTLEFLGRADDQVKIRGFRIELGEIETVLAAHPGVREAVVVARNPDAGRGADQAGGKRLVAYVVPGQEQRTTQRVPDQEQRGEEFDSQFSILNSQFSGELRAFLQEKLPAYMVPALFVVLDELPLSSNGKIDRRALPEPSSQAVLTDTYSAPQTDVEQTIARIWQEVLRVENVGRDSNFFDLGGHSLLLAQVHTRLREIFGPRLMLLDLFRYPTVSALAAYLAPEPEPAQPALDLQPAQPLAEKLPHHGSDVAVIGLAGRFAGTHTVREFWQRLCEGTELITFFDEQELSGVEPALLNDPSYVKAAGYMPDTDLFDAVFFGMSPREATKTDPQHRLLLMCAWQALENAGYDPAAYRGRIGVYAGASTNEYGARALAFDQQSDDMVAMIGNDRDHLATRVSYKLNLRGPSLNVQTACSTSLVAVHLACRSLLNSECEMALAGGVSVQSLEKTGYTYQEAGILSPDGHCRTFDADARGTVGGSGLGMVVLKRLDAALADGDYIYAVIKGSAINNDGSAKAGYTAPSIEGQAAVIAAAQAAAGVAPETIGYIEAHGTATPLGDPIEIAALTEVFRAGTGARATIAIGSVKSNIGHLDAAAGIAGLIKTVMSLEQGKLPPSLHYKRPNPQIDFDAGPFYVNTTLAEWPRGATPRRAGVSSFGIGGTNAHLVLEEAPASMPTPAMRPWHLLLLSARTESALERATDQLAAHLKQTPDVDMGDVAYTLQVGRRAFDHCRIYVVSDLEDAVNGLETRDPARVVSAALPKGARSVAFLFPGQGAQYAGMAADLYQSEPRFREEVDRCATILLPHLGLDLRELLYPTEQRTKNQEPRTGAVDEEVLGSRFSVLELDQTQYTQPALFVIEYALARLLMSWGIRPAAMIGHSIGEYVAACLAGVFSLEDALRLVARRGQLMQGLAGGVMLAVPLPEEQLRPLLGTDLDLASVNGPSQCVVAGPAEAIERLAARLAEQDVVAQRLHTSHAFHSAMMDPIVATFTDEVRGVRLNPPRIPYLSNVSGTWITEADATDPSYWARHLRGTVRFGEGIAELLNPARILLEVGPGRSLSTLVKRRPDIGAEQAIISSLRHPHDQRSDVATVLETVGRLWLAGAPIDWPALAGEQRRRVPLPSYPFELQRYWIDAPSPSETAQRHEPALDKKPDIADWFYAPFWKETSPPEWDASEAERSSWLILADACGVGEQIAARLRAAGHPVVTVTPGTRFARSGQAAYTIDPRQRPMYDTLLGELRAQDTLPSAILHCWSVTADGETRPPLERWEATQDLGYYSLVSLVQALADQASGEVRIGVVSNGMHTVTGAETTRPEKATLLGASRVIGQEYPQIVCRSIDIRVPQPGTWQADDLSDRLIAELMAPTADLAVAYRDGRRWVQLFEAVRQQGLARRPARLRDGGVYLITGGLGGVGLACAAYLAQHAHARLVLIGRSGLPDRDTWAGWLAAHDQNDQVSRTIREVQALEAQGAEVLVFQADVTDLARMRSVVEQTYARYGAIHGVVHAAGLAGGGVIPLQTTDSLAQVLAPKLHGTLVLDSLFKDAGLDFLVLCSSLRTITGGLGALDYCAANAFLDAFAHSASAQSRTFMVAVNWDAWSDVGMSAEALKRQAEQAGSTGQYGMSTAEGQEVFRRVLSASLPQLVIATRDLQAVIAQEPTNAASEPATAEAAQQPVAADRRPQLRTTYTAPSSEVERIIAGIWQELLGVAPIGIDDNFFELGGDSIISLQAAAKAKRFHLRLTPRQMLEHQTIAQLALVVERDQRILAQQELVTGEAPLTPIQRWFFEQDLADRQHWNQAQIFAVRQELDTALLEQAFQQVLAHHDALRMRFAPMGDGWRQSNSAETGLPLVYRELSAHTATERAAEIEATATELQSSLDLTDGPLARIALFKCGAGEPNRLLIIIHHLVVDVVSWGILLEDLEAAYQQLRRGEAVLLPPKTTSFKQWAERLVTHAQSDELRAELDYWLAPAQLYAAPLPLDHPDGQNTIASTEHAYGALDAEATYALMHELPGTYQVQPNELLLAALASVLAEWTGGQALWVDLEGHGREDLFADIDLSRTVGWCTSLFPVCLDVSAAGEPNEALQVVKEQLGRIPNRGIGYGLLRYLSQNASTREQLATLPQPEVAFLYLGQADQQASSGSALLEPLQEEIGPAQSTRGQRHHRLEISAWVAEGQLQCGWRYSAQLYHHSTISEIVQRFVDTVRSLIDGCRAQTYTKEYSVTDFPYANLSQEDLNELIADLGDL